MQEHVLEQEVLLENNALFDVCTVNRKQFKITINLEGLVRPLFVMYSYQNFVFLDLKKYDIIL